MAYKWFRMYAEFRADPKVQTMPEAMQRRLVMLYCLRCEQDEKNDGIALTADEIAFALRISSSELEKTKAIFAEKGFIGEDWTIPAWEKRQYKSDSSGERVKKHREKKRKSNVTCNEDVTEVKRYKTVTVTAPEAEAETEAETDQNIPLTPKGEAQKKGSGKAESTKPDIEIRKRIYLAWQEATGRHTGADVWETDGKNDRHICRALKKWTETDLLRAIQAQCKDAFWHDKTFGGLLKEDNICAGLAKAQKGNGIKSNAEWRLSEESKAWGAIAINIDEPRTWEPEEEEPF